jgi:hypothetical protein
MKIECFCGFPHETVQMQSLIDQSRFVTSDWAVSMVLRRNSFARLAGASDKLLISNSQLETKSACLAGAAAEVRA